jgi:hypothetical protein
VRRPSRRGRDPGGAAAGAPCAPPAPRSGPGRTARRWQGPRVRTVGELVLQPSPRRPIVLMAPVRSAPLWSAEAGGNRTRRRLAEFAIVQSYLSTAAKWGIDALDALRQLFTTGPWLPPALTPAAATKTA